MLTGLLTRQQQKELADVLEWAQSTRAVTENEAYARFEAFSTLEPLTNLLRLKVRSSSVREYLECPTLSVFANTLHPQIMLSSYRNYKLVSVQRAREALKAPDFGAKYYTHCVLCKRAIGVNHHELALLAKKKPVCIVGLSCLYRLLVRKAALLLLAFCYVEEYK